MANTLTKPNVIKVGNAIGYTKSTAVTVSTSATLSSLFTGGVKNKFKNIVITPPTGSVENVPMIGETASAEGSALTFQNYILDEKPWTLAKVTGTQLLDVNEDDFDAMNAGTGTAVVTNTYTEYQHGASDSGKKRVAGAFLVVFKHGTGIREVLLNNLWIMNLGDIKATGADGHLERDFEAICAAEYYIDRFKD